MQIGEWHFEINLSLIFPKHSFAVFAGSKAFHLAENAGEIIGIRNTLRKTISHSFPIV